MSSHVLLDLLNKLRKRDKMQGLSGILSLILKFLMNSINKRALGPWITHLSPGT